MTALEALPKIALLLAQLVERVKDRQTAALVQQVQAFYQVVQAGYFQAESKSLDYQRELVRLESELAALKTQTHEEISSLKDSQRKEVSKLHAAYRTTIKEMKTPRRVLHVTRGS